MGRSGCNDSHRDNDRAGVLVSLRSIKSALVAVLLRSRYLYRKCWYSIVFFGKPVSVHPTSRISRRSVVRIRGGGSISIGRECTLHDYSMILTHGGDVRIGDHCSLNPFVIVYGHGGVRIGDGVRIAAHTVVIPGNHNPTVDGAPLYLSGTVAKGIEIGDHVWLGAGSRILDGVSIGGNAVVGAGAVVTKSVPANSTVGGVPARLIRQRQ